MEKQARLEAEGRQIVSAAVARITGKKRSRIEDSENGLGSEASERIMESESPSEPSASLVLTSSSAIPPSPSSPAKRRRTHSDAIGPILEFVLLLCFRPSFSQLAARDRSQFEFYKRQFELDREERRREREQDREDRRREKGEGAGGSTPANGDVCWIAAKADRVHGRDSCSFYAGSPLQTKSINSSSSISH